MDPDKDIAEERLLRVIEQGQPRSAAAVLGGRAGNPFKIIRNWLVRFYARPVGDDSDPLLSALRALSWLLWIGIACFVIYFAKNFITFNATPVQKKVWAERASSQSKNGVAPAESLPGKLKDESYYVS